MDFKYIYKICTKLEWEEAKLKGKFNGSKKDLEDGYIHFSDKEQIEDTLKKFFKNQKNLILLKINALELDHLIYEQSSEGNMFPHLYSYHFFHSLLLRHQYKSVFLCHLNHRLILTKNDIKN